MRDMKRAFASIILGTIWISASEFVRNEVLLKKQWLNHYESLGINFPADLGNGVVWGIWSIAFAGLIYILLTKFSLLETIFISWFAGFVLMWLVIGNLGVLPPLLILIAGPLSIIEVAVGSYIIGGIGGFER